jgi:hypothetical protein
MRSFLINKNLCLYYWLKRRVGKKWAFGVANILEKAVLMFGREEIPCSDRNWDDRCPKGDAQSRFQDY